MTITVEIKSSYGRSLAYPACDKAKIFAGMLGAKTLTRSALKAIEALGFTINTTSNASLEDVQ
jgi:hypothetical protein